MDVIEDGDALIDRDSFELQRSSGMKFCLNAVTDVGLRIRIPPRHKIQLSFTDTSRARSLHTRDDRIYPLRVTHGELSLACYLIVLFFTTATRTTSHPTKNSPQ